MHGLYLIVAKGGLRGFNGDGKRSSEGGGVSMGGFVGLGITYWEDSSGKHLAVFH